MPHVLMGETFKEARDHEPIMTIYDVALTAAGSRHSGRTGA